MGCSAPRKTEAGRSLTTTDASSHAPRNPPSRPTSGFFVVEFRPASSHFRSPLPGPPSPGLRLATANVGSRPPRPSLVAVLRRKLRAKAPNSLPGKAATAKKLIAVHSALSGRLFPSVLCVPGTRLPPFLLLPPSPLPRHSDPSPVPSPPPRGAACLPCPPLGAAVRVVSPSNSVPCAVRAANARPSSVVQHIPHRPLRHPARASPPHRPSPPSSVPRYGTSGAYPDVPSLLAGPQPRIGGRSKAPRVPPPVTGPLLIAPRPPPLRLRGPRRPGRPPAYRKPCTRPRTAFQMPPGQPSTAPRQARTLRCSLACLPTRPSSSR